MVHIFSLFLKGDFMISDKDWDKVIDEVDTTSRTGVILFIKVSFDCGPKSLLVLKTFKINYLILPL